MSRRHFTILVYPFRCRSSRKTVARDAPLFWRSLYTRFDSEAGRRFADDTFYFLPHIRSFLFAEDGHLTSGRDSLLATPDDVMVRLTLDPAVLRDHNPISVLQPGMATPIRFQIDWADVLLFPQEVGFLALKISPTDAEWSLETINSMLTGVRQLFSPAVSIDLPRWRTAAGLELEGRELVEFLLQGWAPLAPVAETALPAFVTHFRGQPHDKQYTWTSDGQTYGEAFRLYTFLAMPQDAWESGPSAPFTSAWDRHLYELATLTSLGDPAFFPHRRYAEEFSADLLAIWDDWRGVVRADHVVFGARSDAYTPYLEHNVEFDYFYLHMLSMFVKMRLSLFFSDLIQRNPSLLRNLFASRAIAKSFVRFQNEFWFPEVTHKPQGSVLYDRFQNAHANPRMYSELNDKVQSLVGHLEQRYQFATAVLIALLVAPRTFQEIAEGVAWLIERSLR